MSRIPELSAASIQHIEKRQQKALDNLAMATQKLDSLRQCYGHDIELSSRDFKTVSNILQNAMEELQRIVGVLEHNAAVTSKQSDQNVQA